MPSRRSLAEAYVDRFRLIELKWQSSRTLCLFSLGLCGLPCGILW